MPPASASALTAHRGQAGAGDIVDRSRERHQQREQHPHPGARARQAPGGDDDEEDRAETHEHAGDAEPAEAVEPEHQRERVGGGRDQRRAEREHRGRQPVGDVGDHQQRPEEAEDRDQREDPQILPPERGRLREDRGQRQQHHACEQRLPERIGDEGEARVDRDLVGGEQAAVGDAAEQKQHGRHGEPVFAQAPKRPVHDRVPSRAGRCGGLVGTPGFEPGTSCMSSKRSPPELSARAADGRDYHRACDVGKAGRTDDRAGLLL